MFSELLVLTERERYNLATYRQRLKKQQQQVEEKRQLQQEEGYFDNILEEVGVQQASYSFYIPKGTQRKHSHSSRCRSVDNFIQQAKSVQKLDNIWRPADVQRLKTCIETVGLDPVLIQIMMPERTQRAIRRRLRYENPEELVRLSYNFVAVPDDVKQIYERLIGERDENLDIDDQLAEEEVGGRYDEISQGQRDDVQQIFNEFDF